jgi:DNA-binding IclR family transcriptional regulator
MVGNAFRILEVFEDGGPELSLQEIARRAKVNKTSALRILFTLEKQGYVNRSAKGSRYQLGAKIIDLARRVIASRDLVQLARPYMKKLHAKFDETINLAVLRESEIVYVEILESGRPFRMAAKITAQVPIHCTALGKCIAAFLPEQQLQSILSSIALSSYTRATITKMDRFRAELQKVHRKRCAIDNEETEVGAYCIGVPILDRRGEPTAALSISGPSYRVRKHRSAMIQQLQRASSTLEHVIEASNL